MPLTRPAALIAALILTATPVSAKEARMDKASVDAAVVEWKEAVESASVDNIIKLYDRKAVMISTFVQNPMDRRQELADYYKKVVENPDIHVEILETHPRVFGDMAVNSGRYTLSYTQEGEPVDLPARFSFTYVLKDGKWVIVDHHSSRVPLPEEKK